ncbi:MAG: LppX_LprAFG lipoprotein [Nocardiaceae bacterium]|nr:LppX_LprAFG lipoprotein [Nocardiaceae bacterium]
MTWARLLFITLLAATLGMATACSKPDMPPAAGLLKQSAEATAAVNSIHLVIKVNGDPEGVKVRNVDGDVDRAGNARGSLKVSLSGTVIEGDFVIVNGQAYFRGPTGKFTEYTAERTRDLYDATAILDPNRGLAHLLTVATDTESEDIDTIDGQDAYKISGKLTKEQVAPLVPGLKKNLDVVFWVPVNGPRHVLRVWFSTPDADTAPTVEVKVSDFDKPFTVAKPALG